MSASSPSRYRLGIALLVAAVATAAQANCLDGPPSAEPADTAATAMPVGSPHQRLQAMAREALARSAQVGAAQLLAQAAQADLAETRAQRQPLASLQANLAAQSSQTAGNAAQTGLAAGASLNVGAPLYDSGRHAALIDWRSSMADAARLGQLGAQEQVVFQTVALALDRNRYRLQGQVYDHYVRKMACLVSALQDITQADKGRASELVQARKSLQQAELLREQAQTALAQSELRLRRFVGDSPPSGEGITSVLMMTPALADVVAEMPLSPELATLTRQAEAAADYARAVQAGSGLQVGWTAGARGLAGSGQASGSERRSLSAGITLSMPLVNPAADHAVNAAKLRAGAAARQLQDMKDAREARAREVHAQALAASDRARRVAQVLRDSDTLRHATVQQWRQLARRSLFDVMAAEGDHYGLRAQHIHALYDGLQANAMLHSLGRGLSNWLLNAAVPPPQ